ELVEVIEAEGPMESIGKYLADLYKAASDALANMQKLYNMRLKVGTQYFVDKIQQIRTYSADNIASYNADELELIIDY
ncbi:31931_t:CDS:2, partial [Gigaspora margarita]